MSNSIFISIIVPIYKVEQYLDKCMESLLGQTFTNVEIILVDDGSPDKCPQMCDDYARKDSRIQVIHKANGGLSDARNAGLGIAKGRYIMFVDSDDYIELDASEVFYNIAKDSDADIIVGDAIVHNKNMSLCHNKVPALKLFSGSEYLKTIYRLQQKSMAAWLNIYKRDFLQSNGLKFKKGILHEDEEFTPRALLCASSVVYSGKAFYHYIIRDNSITTKKDQRKNATDLYNTCCELEKLYRSIDDLMLRDYLLNSLVDKYLNIFQVGNLHQYGEGYIHKEFVKRNAKIKRTRLRAYLFAISPKLYYYINKLTKIKRFEENK